jgi:hypothetical protein
LFFRARFRLSGDSASSHRALALSREQIHAMWIASGDST